MGAASRLLLVARFLAGRAAFRDAFRPGVRCMLLSSEVWITVPRGADTGPLVVEAYASGGAMPETLRTRPRSRGQ